MTWNLQIRCKQVPNLPNCYNFPDLLLYSQCSQVAPYKKVRKVAFVTEIPKNASGKILRKDLIKVATSKL